MKAIRSQDTEPEMKVRKLLFSSGFRYRLHARKLPGKPDIVLPKYRLAIFVQGCFWHNHGCYLFEVPKTRTDFWVNKLSENCARDSRNQHLLLNAGWRVLYIWECALKGRQRKSDEYLKDELEKIIRAPVDQVAVLNISCDDQ